MFVASKEKHLYSVLQSNKTIQQRKKEGKEVDMEDTYIWKIHRYGRYVGMEVGFCT